MIKDYQFDGWDWHELAECFEVSCGEYDDKCCDKLQNFLKSHNYHGDSYSGPKAPDNKAAEVVEICRKYLKKLAEHNIGYYTPLWSGLTQVERDGEFMKVFVELLPFMWT